MNIEYRNIELAISYYHFLSCFHISYIPLSNIGNAAMQHQVNSLFSLRDWAADGKWFEDPKEEVDEEHQRLPSLRWGVSPSHHGSFMLFQDLDDVGRVAA